jgi:hypothetical protein
MRWLADSIGPERAAAESDAVTELSALCARLPLALAVAAARASLQPRRDLAALASELRDARGRLDGLDAGRTAPMCGRCSPGRSGSCLMRRARRSR